MAKRYSREHVGVLMAALDCICQDKRVRKVVVKSRGHWWDVADAVVPFCLEVRRRAKAIRATDPVAWERYKTWAEFFNEDIGLIIEWGVMFGPEGPVFAENPDAVVARLHEYARERAEAP